MSVNIELPRPLGGWRVFFGEVGVIVLGVVVALGAQQVAQDLQMQGDVSAFRKTIDREIAFNAYVYDVRARQESCLTGQLDALDAWLERARNGDVVPPLAAAGPVTFSYYRSAWDNRNANVFAHLPDQTRQKYGEFYDELANNTHQSNLEADAWRDLAPYVEPGALSLDDRRKIRSTLSEARALAGKIVGNIAFSGEIASELGVRKIAPDGLEEMVAEDLARCASPIANQGQD
jgi:hypothetical protein